MKTKFVFLGIFGLGLFVSATMVANGAFAQADPSGIQFPVAELGNCKDKDSCKAYCDDTSHADACFAFAEKNNLMSKDEIDTAKKFMEAGGKGPGGCRGKDECQSYCDEISHIDACVAFAEKTGILPPEQLAEAKQVQSAITKGVKPPACKGKKECDVYCEDPSHMKECVAFGEAAGFLKGNELEDAKKMLTAIDNGATPPPCKGKEACDAYCSEPDHMEACMTFAQAAGFMTPEEAQNSQKMLAALRKGVKPPACKGKEACDAYCTDSAHTDECIQFSVAAGFMSDKEADMAKKTGGKGPGGCVGKDACDAFCGNPDNQQTCIDFGKENGMISEEEAGRMQEGQKKFKESIQNIPPEVENCLKTALGDDAVEKMKSGQAMPSRDAGEKMGSCFSHMGPPPGQEGQSKEGQSREMQNQGPMPPQGQQERSAQFMQRIESGKMPPGEQRPPEGQFTPGTYPNQPPSGSGEQFIPGIYPNQGQPPEGTSGTYPYQSIQNVPVPGTQTQPMMPTSEGTAPTPPPPSMAPVETSEGTAPGTPIPQAQPVEPTAPQSFNFDLKSSFAAAITALKGSKF